MFRRESDFKNLLNKVSLMAVGVGVIETLCNIKNTT
jgi:hypothetical protein